MRGGECIVDIHIHQWREILDNFRFMQCIEIGLLHPHFILMLSNIVEEQHVTRIHVANRIPSDVPTNIWNESDGATKQSTQEVRVSIHVGEVDSTGATLVCQNNHA